MRDPRRPRPFDATARLGHAGAQGYDTPDELPEYRKPGALTGDLQRAEDRIAEGVAKVDLDVVRGRILANVDDHLSGDIDQSRDRPVSWRKGRKEVHEDDCIFVERRFTNAGSSGASATVIVNEAVAFAAAKVRVAFPCAELPALASTAVAVNVGGRSFARIVARPSATVSRAFLARLRTNNDGFVVLGDAVVEDPHGDADFVRSPRLKVSEPADRW